MSAIRKNLVYSELLRGLNPLDDYLNRLLDEVKKHPRTWKGAGWQDALPDYLYDFYAKRPKNESLSALGEGRILTGLLEHKNILTGEQLRALQDTLALSPQDFSQEEQPRKSTSISDIDFSDIPEACVALKAMIKGLGNLTGSNYRAHLAVIETCFSCLDQDAKNADDRAQVSATRDYFRRMERLSQRMTC